MAIIMQSASIASLVYTRRAMGVPPGVASLTTLAANRVIETNEVLQALTEVLKSSVEGGVGVPVGEGWARWLFCCD